MDTTRKLVLEALDVLGSRTAAIDTELNKLRDDKSMFDAEARIYFIASLGKRINEAATRLHGLMHKENSIPGNPFHTDDCLHGIKMTAVALFAALAMFAAPAGAWEFSKNPDRFISVGLNATKLNVDVSGHTTLPSGAAAGSDSTDLSGNSIVADVRVPVHQSLTLTLTFERFSQDQASHGLDNLGSPAYTNNLDFTGRRVGLGVRYYFNK